MPRLARTGSSTPSSTKVCWPIFGAVQGVAGARITSTSLNNSSTCVRYQRRNFCACPPGQPAPWRPAISRSRTTGSKSRGAPAQAIEMQRRALGGGDHIGGGAGALGLGKLDLAIGAERGRDPPTAARASGNAPLRK